MKIARVPVLGGWGGWGEQRVNLSHVTKVRVIWFLNEEDFFKVSSEITPCISVYHVKFSSEYLVVNLLVQVVGIKLSSMICQWYFALGHAAGTHFKGWWPLIDRLNVQIWKTLTDQLATMSPGCTYYPFFGGVKPLPTKLLFTCKYICLVQISYGIN